MVPPPAPRPPFEDQIRTDVFYFFPEGKCFKLCESMKEDSMCLYCLVSLDVHFSLHICLWHCLINILISGVTPVSGIGGSSPSSNFPSFLPLIGSTPPNSNISQCLQQPAGSFLNSKKYIHLTCTSTSKGCHQVFPAISRLWVTLPGWWTNI